MPQLDLLTQYSVSKATDQNQGQLLNMYLEEQQTTSLAQHPYKASPDVPKGEYKVIALPTFGLTTFCDTTQANIRALLEHNEVLYAVAGNKLYSINSGGTKTELGTLNTSSGFAKIVVISGASDTNNQLVIIDATNGYHYNITTATATFPITDVDFPQTASDITVQDDYVLAEVNNSLQFFLSNVADGTSWAALDFASKIRKADRINGIISYKGEVFLFGTKTIEVWTNSGNASFPFERRSDVFIELGNAAQRSIVLAADKLFFLGKSLTGGYGFIVLDGYNPVTISTKDIMSAICALTTISDCIGYSYAKDGHEFIDWTFPTDNKTFTYDTSNGTWIVRQSYLNSAYGRFLGQCQAFCYNKSLIGDYNSGKIYTQSRSIYTENGTAIRRQFISPYLYSEGKRIYLERLQIDCQTNVGTGTFLLEMSTDRGNTWETIDTYTVPTSGDGTIYTTSLGSAFCFAFRITTTDNFNFVLLGFQAQYSLAAH